MLFLRNFLLANNPFSYNEVLAHLQYISHLSHKRNADLSLVSAKTTKELKNMHIIIKLYLSSFIFKTTFAIKDSQFYSYFYSFQFLLIYLSFIVQNYQFFNSTFSLISLVLSSFCTPHTWYFCSSNYFNSLPSPYIYFKQNISSSSVVQFFLHLYFHSSFILCNTDLAFLRYFFLEVLIYFLLHFTQSISGSSVV